MWKNLGVIAVIVIVGVLAWVSRQPDSFRIERQVTIQAPAGTIFPLLNDFHQWALWSPWEKKDPGMKRDFSGPDTGVGAAYEWSGNSDVGSGRMEIIQSMPATKLAVDLHFTAPFEADNTAEFVLEDKDGATTVTWAMFGASPLLSKLMGLVFDMDSMVGGDFARGLASLKTAAEAAGQAGEPPRTVL